MILYDLLASCRDHQVVLQRYCHGGPWESSSALLLSANATLLGRLPTTPGGTDFQAAYDDVLDITWVTNGDAYTRCSCLDQACWA